MLKWLWNSNKHILKINNSENRFLKICFLSSNLSIFPFYSSNMSQDNENKESIIPALMEKYHSIIKLYNAEKIKNNVCIHPLFLLFFFSYYTCDL